MNKSQVPAKKTVKIAPKVEEPPKPNIRITVINADLLQNIEEGGTKMDPYIKIRYVEQDKEKEILELKTKVDMDAGVNPKWDQMFEVIIEELRHDLYFEVWEWDKNSSDDFLAIGKISMESCLAYGGAPFGLEVLRSEKMFGTLYLRVEKLSKSKEEIRLEERLAADEQVQRFSKYLSDIGLQKAFKLIFAEILTKKIDKTEMFLYTALRLKQIGDDLRHVLPKPAQVNISSLLNNISDMNETKQEETNQNQTSKAPETKKVDKIENNPNHSKQSSQHDTPKKNHPPSPPN